MKYLKSNTLNELCGLIRPLCETRSQFNELERDLCLREQTGKIHYNGKTLDRTDLDRADFRQHAIEEVLDALMYAVRAGDVDVVPGLFRVLRTLRSRRGQ